MAGPEPSWPNPDGTARGVCREKGVIHLTGDPDRAETGISDAPPLEMRQLMLSAGSWMAIDHAPEEEQHSIAAKSMGQ